VLCARGNAVARLILLPEEHHNFHLRPRRVSHKPQRFCMGPLRGRLLFPEIVRAGEWRQSKKQGDNWDNRSECCRQRRSAARRCPEQSGDRRSAWNSHTSTSSMVLTVTGFLRLEQLFSRHSAEQSVWIAPSRRRPCVGIRHASRRPDLDERPDNPAVPRVRAYLAAEFKT
jgi:hypothetical protein